MPSATPTEFTKSMLPAIGRGVNPNTRSTSPNSATLRMDSIFNWSVVMGGLGMNP